MERFLAIKEEMRDIKENPELFNGYYTAPDINLCEESRTLVKKLIQKMEALQQADNMEHDCGLLYKQIWETENCIWEGTEDLSEFQIMEKVEKVQNLTEQLEYIKNYWVELEADYEWREKTIQWMKGLPKGWAGIVDFFNGLTDTYIRAFVLSIEVESPVQYRVHWFDDAWSDIKMYDNMDKITGWRQKGGKNYDET